VIEFLCPNGHKIQCAAAQAGKAAKCPKCGVKFLIPEPAELQDLDDEEPAAAVEPAARPAAPRPAAPSPRPSPKEQQIEFLCPGGHRLHGPASLQGHPGECPECGARFRIPAYDEAVSDEEHLETNIAVGRANGRHDSDEAIPAPAKPKPARGDSGSGLLRGPQLVGRVPADQPPPHPMAQVFAKLWVEKARGATVELHLDGGDVLVPDQFSKTLSQPSQGVFAVKAENGTFTLTVIAWDAVQRLVVSGVKKLPEG
jgi:DNA-directed RNA polymerase subunit RPC12/RpoP